MNASLCKKAFGDQQGRWIPELDLQVFMSCSSWMLMLMSEYESTTEVATDLNH